MLAIGSVRHARWPYRAGLNLRFLGLKLDERDRGVSLRRRKGGTRIAQRLHLEASAQRGARLTDDHIIQPPGFDRIAPVAAIKPG